MDYTKLGLKAGLEIHQQLDTGKLFSRTPSLLRSDEPDYLIRRKLHRVAGEMGEVDAAVEHEAVLDKEFVYQGYDDTISLVELDESPPQEIDRDALNEAIKIALLLNCEIYPIAQIMRKTVIDGSNTSGFQRSVLIGHSGEIETSFGKVGIGTIALEEDAARIVKRGDKEVIFRLDRLGIPLVEITTKPVLTSAEQIKECALKIGEILRVCKVKRGIGTIRQDLNISIKGHDRVEIKGFQEPRIMMKTIELEVERQLAELKKKKTSGEVRNALASGETEFLRPLPGKARMYPETDLPLLRISRERINSLKRELPRLKGEIRDELKGKGLSPELINLLLTEPYYLDQFNILSRVYGKNKELVAKMISLWRHEFANKFKKPVGEILKILHERVLEGILERVKSGEIVERDVRDVMRRIVEGVEFEEALKVEKKSDDEIEVEIRKIIREKPGLRTNAYMGLVMQKFKGKIDAKRAMEIIRRILGDEA